MLELHTTRCNLNRSETALNKLKSELDSSRAMEESLKNECATWKKSYEVCKFVQLTFFPKL